MARGALSAPGLVGLVALVAVLDTVVGVSTFIKIYDSEGSDYGRAYCLPQMHAGGAVVSGWNNDAIASRSQWGTTARPLAQRLQVFNWIASDSFCHGDDYLQANLYREGRVRDLESLEGGLLEGKVAQISAGDCPWDTWQHFEVDVKQRVNAAKFHGAVGVVILLGNDHQMPYVLDEPLSLPACMMSKVEGFVLRDARGLPAARDDQGLRIDLDQMRELYDPANEPLPSPEVTSVVIQGVPGLGSLAGGLGGPADDYTTEVSIPAWPATWNPALAPGSAPSLTDNIIQVVIKDACVLKGDRAKTPFRSCTECWALLENDGYPFAYPEPFQLTGRVALFPLDESSEEHELSLCYPNFWQLAAIAEKHGADGVLLGQPDLGSVPRPPGPYLTAAMPDIPTYALLRVHAEAIRERLDDHVPDGTPLAKATLPNQVDQSYPLFFATNKAEMAETVMSLRAEGQPDTTCRIGQAHFNPREWPGLVVAPAIHASPFGACNVGSCDGCRLRQGAIDALAASGSQVLVIDEDEWRCFHSWAQLADLAVAGGAEALVVINSSGEEVYTYQAEDRAALAIPTFNAAHACGVRMHASAAGDPGGAWPSITLPQISNGEATEGQSGGQIVGGDVLSRLEGRVGLPATEISVAVSVAQGHGASSRFVAGQAAYNPFITGGLREKRLVRFVPVPACTNENTAGGTACGDCLRTTEGDLFEPAAGSPDIAAAPLKDEGYVAAVAEWEALCLHPIATMSRMLIRQGASAVLVANVDSRISTLVGADGERLAKPTVNVARIVFDYIAPAQALNGRVASSQGRVVTVSMSPIEGGVMEQCFGGCSRDVDDGVGRGEEAPPTEIVDLPPPEGDGGRNQAVVVAVASTLAVVGCCCICGGIGWCWHRRRMAAYNQFDQGTQMGSGLTAQDDDMWKVSAMPNEIYEGDRGAAGGVGNGNGFDGVEMGGGGEGGSRPSSPQTRGEILRDVGSQ